MGENVEVSAEGPIKGLASLYVEKCWYCAREQVPAGPEDLGLCGPCKDILRRYE